MAPYVINYILIILKIHLKAFRRKNIPWVGQDNIYNGYKQG